MAYQTDRVSYRTIKLATGEEYPYIEVSITQQEAIYGFYLEVAATSLRPAASTTYVLAGYEALDPEAELLGFTYFDVLSAASESRSLGDVNLNFTAQEVNRIFIKPGSALGPGITLPDILPPVMGFYIEDDGLKIARTYKTKGS